MTDTFFSLRLQICFLVSAFRGRVLSEDSCAALALFAHYFHLSQFFWMLIQVTGSDVLNPELLIVYLWYATYFARIVFAGFDDTVFSFMSFVLKKQMHPMFVQSPKAHQWCWFTIRRQGQVLLCNVRGSVQSVCWSKIMHLLQRPNILDKLYSLFFQCFAAVSCSSSFAVQYDHLLYRATYRLLCLFIVLMIFFTWQSFFRAACGFYIITSQTSLLRCVGWGRFWLEGKIKVPERYLTWPLTPDWYHLVTPHPISSLPPLCFDHLPSVSFFPFYSLFLTELPRTQVWQVQSQFAA